METMKIIYLSLSIFLSLTVMLSSQEEDLKKEEIQTRLEVTKLSTEGQNLLKAKKPLEAWVISEKIFKKNPNSPESYYIKGASLYSQKKYYQAIEYLRKAIQIQPTHDPSLFVMGLTYFHLKQFLKAKDFFAKAAEEGSFNPFYRYNLALSYFILQDYEKAIQEAEKTLQLKENYFKVKVILAKSYYYLGKKKEAFELTSEMIDQNIEINKIFPIYIQLLIELEKNYEKAIQLLSKRKNLSREERKFLAFSYMQLGNWGNAITHYKTVLKIERDNEEDILNLIQCYVWNENLTEAENLLSELIKFNKSNRKLYLNFFQEILEKKAMHQDLYSPF